MGRIGIGVTALAALAFACYVIAGEGGAKANHADAAGKSGCCAAKTASAKEGGCKKVAAEVAELPSYKQANEVLQSWSEVPAKLAAMTDSDKSQVQAAAKRLHESHPAAPAMMPTMEYLNDSLATLAYMDRAAQKLCAAQAKGEAQEGGCPKKAAAVAEAKNRMQRSQALVAKAGELMLAAYTQGKNGCAKNVSAEGCATDTVAAKLTAGGGEGGCCKKEAGAKLTAAGGDGCCKKSAEAKLTAAGEEKGCAKKASLAAGEEKGCAKKAELAAAGEEPKSCAKKAELTAAEEQPKACAKKASLASGEEKHCAKKAELTAAGEEPKACEKKAKLAAAGEEPKSCAKKAELTAAEEPKTCAKKAELTAAGEEPKTCAKTAALAAAEAGEGCAKSGKVCHKTAVEKANKLVQRSGEVLARWGAADIRMAALTDGERSAAKDAFIQMASQCPAGSRMAPTLSSIAALLRDAASAEIECRTACTKAGVDKEIPAELKELAEARSMLIAATLNVLQKVEGLGAPAKQQMAAAN